MIEQADQAEPLRDRNHLLRGNQRAVGAADAHQALMECRLPRLRVDHRLERDQDAALVERGDDLVGRAHVLAAHRVTLDVRTIELERALTLGLGGIERLLGARKDFRHGLGVARRGDAAER